MKLLTIIVVLFCVLYATDLGQGSIILLERDEIDSTSAEEICRSQCLAFDEEGVISFNGKTNKCFCKDTSGRKILFAIVTKG